MPDLTPEQQARSDESAARVEAMRRARSPHLYGAESGVQPDAPEWETYEIPSTEDRPEFDEAKVQSLAQQHAAPGIRTLREAYQTAASRLPSDPKSRLTLRDALKGYGSGLESVMGGARKTARQEEMQKFGIESAAFQQDYAAQLQQARDMAQLENDRMMQQFQMDYTEFLGDEADQPQSGGFYHSSGTWIPPGTPGAIGQRPGV